MATVKTDKLTPNPNPKDVDPSENTSRIRRRRLRDTDPKAEKPPEAAVNLAEQAAREQPADAVDTAGASLFPTEPAVEHRKTYAIRPDPAIPDPAFDISEYAGPKADADTALPLPSPKLKDDAYAAIGRAYVWAHQLDVPVDTFLDTCCWVAASIRKLGLEDKFNR